FSYLYLASSLFGTDDLKIKEQKIKARVKEVEAKRGNAEENAKKLYDELQQDKEMMRKRLAEKNKTV
ncbi:MAG: YkgJ family cysteine cluster protein, partial [Deltaproteobacteria bacterium]|nr:YkgJ family cysteine cluster protein [Deltaproteobacteria bacterium]